MKTGGLSGLCGEDARQAPRNRCAHHLPERRGALEEAFPVTSEQTSDRRPGDALSAASDADGRVSEEQLRRHRVHRVTWRHSVTASACATMAPEEGALGAVQQ